MYEQAGHNSRVSVMTQLYVPLFLIINVTYFLIQNASHVESQNISHWVIRCLLGLGLGLLFIGLNIC